MPVDIRGMAPLLQVFDMPTSIHFYCDILGFEVVSTSGPGPNYGWALLTFKGVEVMLNTAYDDGQRPANPDPARVAAHGDTGLFFGCEDLDGTYQHFVANGLKVNPPKVAPYGMRQLYVKDPDNFGLCFQWPASQEMQDSWMERYGLEPKTVG